MALKNRNQNIAGRFRVSVVCPACGSACITLTSERITPLTRQHYLQCTNMLCGWTGVGMFEITRTTSPPSKKYADAALPPEVDAEFPAEPANIEGQLF